MQFYAIWHSCFFTISISVIFILYFNDNGNQHRSIRSICLNLWRIHIRCSQSYAQFVSCNQRAQQKMDYQQHYFAFNRSRIDGLPPSPLP